ncbi:MAG TPA: ferritin-like domain-containing protein [Alphaproteobacteria bacterium]|nr:ferritin-like domain-containing protein [Alphaproteobacteria bacterium]
MPAIISLPDLFEDMLKDIYYAEKKILKALPKMSKKLGKQSKLAAAFDKHCLETEGQVERLEQVFRLINKAPKAKKCDAIEGLTAEADELMKNVECQATLEAGLLAGAQAVEHYEIARYGTLIAWAKLLDLDEAADLLEETLDQEKKTDDTLNDMAEDEINEKALEAAHQTREERKQKKAA